MSLPVWECGLKLATLCTVFAIKAVTPCMGVWIEIKIRRLFGHVCGSSLPVWECGLKYDNSNPNETPFVSLPVWECGLKSRRPV